MTIPQFTAGQILTAAELNVLVDAINAGGGSMEVTAFTASGTFTPPAGVTYAIAHIRAGGGGVGSASAGTGGTSSVAFAGGTISATGGLGFSGGNFATESGKAGTANSGQGAQAIGNFANVLGSSLEGHDGAYIVAGGAVTPAVGITVTVGAGGAAGTGGGNAAAGGSGYVWIEYQV
jgi:hypothetical protein